MEKKVSGRLIAAASCECSNLLYACGFHAADEFIYCEIPNGERLIVVSALEYQRACNEAFPGIKVYDRADIAKAAPVRPGTPFLVGMSQYFNVKSWLVPAQFPLHYADLLRNGGIEVNAADGDFFPQRAVKTDREIALVREAELETQKAMCSVRDFMRAAKVNSDGILEYQGKILTCNFIRAEVEAQFKRDGYSACHTIIACGKDASAPHNIGSGPVFAGQPVVADIFPRNDTTGYWGDMTRTFVKGEAAPIVKKAFQAVKQASVNAMNALKPGVPGAVIHRIAAATMEELGFPTRRNADGIPCGFFHGLGHGVGLDIHENPRVAPSNPDPLPPGSIVSIEPGLYDPAWGGIRLEDLVVVTPSGFENFCTMEKELEIE